jgi:hypothetical protein
VRGVVRPVERGDSAGRGGGDAARADDAASARAVTPAVCMNLMGLHVL